MFEIIREREREGERESKNIHGKRYLSVEVLILPLYETSLTFYVDRREGNRRV